MRLDGKAALVIGKRVGEVCAQNSAAIAGTEQGIVVSPGRFLQ
jgi:hypothetical protein